VIFTDTVVLDLVEADVADLEENVVIYLLQFMVL
jgi:hypothetical protein